MNSSSLRQVLVDWMAVACALTVFVAVALAISDEAPPSAGPAQALSVHHGG